MDNPYQAPSSRVEDLEVRPPGLAGRGRRLGAGFIDGFLVTAIVSPMQYFSGFTARTLEAVRAHERVPMDQVLAWALVFAAIFALLQAYPLIRDGQTWGKKALSIRIATIEGATPSIRHLGIRYGVFLLVRAVPYLGGFVSLVNICFIFRDDRRCLHDLAAGTQVVNT